MCKTRQDGVTVVLPQDQPTHLNKPRLLICFSHLRWSFVHQRPQHLMNCAVASHLVYVVEEPVFEEGVAQPEVRLRTEASGVRIATPYLPGNCDERHMVESQRALLDELLECHSSCHVTFWYYTPMALRFSDHITADLCVYDCMDELSAFKGAPPELKALEDCLFDRADLVFTGGRSLYEAKASRHPNVHAFPSSIDAAHFHRARHGGFPEPEDQARIQRPRIGFFGVVDERMDTDLVAAVAERRPDWHWIMIGPVVKIDPASLPRRPNIHWLGMKSYNDLPQYLAGWDAGFMPFALNEATRFISPTKTPEFLAAGLPVVSTPVCDVQRPYGDMGLVGIAASAEEMTARLQALMTGPRDAWRQATDSFLSGMSWTGTWAAMERLMRLHDRSAMPAAQGETIDV